MNPRDLIAQMSSEQRARMRALCQHDLSRRDGFWQFAKHAWKVLEPETPLVEGGPLPLICKALEAVTEGKIHRLLINVPPGCMKSMLVNTLWPAWEWGPQKRQHLRYISASYEQGLATRDLVRCRDLVKSEWYQTQYGVSSWGELELKEDQDQKTYYQNVKTGWRLAASVRSALTGYRGDRILIDDPHGVAGGDSAADLLTTGRWFTETLPTRLNRSKDDPRKAHAKRSAMVMIMQRIAVGDLSAKAKELGWEVLCLPMRYEVGENAPTPKLQELGIVDWRTEEGQLLWPDRFPEEAVRELERAMGPYAVASQLQQRPVPRGGGMFKRDRAVFVDAAPACTRWVRGWDLAGTEDGGKATVGLKLGVTAENRLVIADVVRVQKESYGVEETIKACARADGSKVAISLPQDPGQAGKAQKARLASILPGYNVHFSLESGDKVDRAVPCASQWDAGNVILVRGPWNDRFLSEAELFGPAGAAFTDQIDAFSRAYAYLLTQRSTSQGFGAPASVV